MVDTVELAGQSQLLVDDHVVDEMRGLTRTLNQLIKYSGNPIVRATQPWERRVSIYGTVMYDPEQELYRMWYQGYGGTPYTVCYATSKDGIIWEKPELGLVDFAGSRENNLVLDDACVFHVIKDSRDGDPGRLYKALFYEAHNPSVSVAFSSDGVRWTKHEGNPLLTGTSDTHTLFGWDDSHGSYVAYVRPGLRDGTNIRVIGRSTSEDFLHWTEPQVVLAPDDKDPPGLEFYGMPVFKYSGVYLGTLWAFHTHPEEPFVRTVGTLDVQLAVSRDGVEWERVGNRAPFIPLGPSGSMDQAMVYTAKEPLVVGDELWFYYGASDSDHGLRRPNVAYDQRTFSICLAKLRLDGFVSIDADSEGGTLVTKPLRCEGGPLLINAYARRGGVSVAVLNEQGVEREGYRKLQCALFDGDSLAHRVTWRESLSLDSLRGQTIRLKFYLRSAKLYSFAIG